jgi:hypothetical protein
MGFQPVIDFQAFESLEAYPTNKNHSLGGYRLEQRAQLQNSQSASLHPTNRQGSHDGARLI